MAKKIEIYENTLLKLLVRRGIDIDRKNVILSEGELGYTTDTKKLYIGDGQTPGGILVQGNSILESTNAITTLSNAVEGDVVYNPSDGKLYRFRGGDYSLPNNWEAIGTTYIPGNNTITIDNNKIQVGQISAGNIHESALGGSLKLDDNKKITIDPDGFSIDNISVSTPTGFLSLPGRLKINSVNYVWPAGGLESNMFLSTDAAGNLTWKALESTTTVLAASPGNLIPVGMIVTAASPDSIPPGWLLCNGQSVLKTAYSDLFAAIGTMYGGDATTFKVPNLIDKVLYGTSNTPETSTSFQLGSSLPVSLSATGCLYIIKAVSDTLAEPTLTISSPLSCTVNGVDKTDVSVPLFDGNIKISIPPSPVLQGSTGYRNKAINGNFDFWQRATSTINSPVTAIIRSRTADRWATYASGVNSGLFSVVRQPCTETELEHFNANYFQRLSYRNGVGSNKLVSLEQFVDVNTDINIIVDSSGSMPTAVNTIEAMVNSGLLKARLLPRYNNDEVLYNQRVKFYKEPGEKTFSTLMLNRGGNGGTKLINLVFQDEADNQGYGAHTNTTAYNTNVTDLRNTLAGYAPNYFMGVVFQITGQPAFKTFLEKVKLGLSPFNSINLADKPEVQFKYDIDKTGTQQYFVDTIESALVSFNRYITYDGPPISEVMDRNDVGVLGIQNFENAAEVLGKTMTLSFWARASQPTKIFSESQIHAMPGATSMWTPTVHKVFDLTTTWQRFTHTYTMPTFQQVSAAAYNPNAFPTPISEAPTYELLGPTNSLPPLSSWLYQIDIKTHWTKRLSIRSGNSPTRPGAAVNYPGEAMTQTELEAINSSVLQEGYYDIAQIQFEEGDTATNFEFRPQGIELGLCQRYYYKTYDVDTPPNTVTDDNAIWSHEPVSQTGGGVHNAQGSFAVPMVRKPTIKFYNPRDAFAATGTYGSVYVYGASTSQNGTVGAVDVSTKRISNFNITYTMSPPAAENLIITGYHFTADAEI